jgi:MHS family proline/betaine transporter-like MFS transporter
LTRAQWKTVILASLGGSLEFYDFIIYGVFAQYIAAAFFPATDRLVSLILVFSVFGVGYLARPVGGIILSHFGDKYGRRKVFIGSLLVISASTFAIGLLPGYAAWGVFAPLALVALRLIQGFCLGGELPGAITYAVEVAPQHAGFACSVVFCFANGGVILATLTNLMLTFWLPPPDMAAWGWRLGFFLGGAAGLFSFRLRRLLEESPEFLRLKQSASRRPLGDVLADYRMPLIFAISTSAVVGCFNGLLIAHMPAYLTRVLHYDARTVSFAQNLCLAIECVGMIAAGWLSDRVPRRRILRLGALLLLTGAYPFYAALGTESVNLLTLFATAGFAAAFANGTFASIMADLFPTRVRFSGVALAFNISFTVFSGMAPLVATSLIRTTGWNGAPTLLMMACAALSLAASVALPKFEGQAIAPAPIH